MTDQDHEGAGGREAYAGPTRSLDELFAAFDATGWTFNMISHWKDSTVLEYSWHANAYGVQPECYLEHASGYGRKTLAEAMEQLLTNIGRTKFSPIVSPRVPQDYDVRPPRAKPGAFAPRGVATKPQSGVGLTTGRSAEDLGL